MSIRTLTAALAAATLVTAPVAAQVAPADRAAAPTTEANELGGIDLWIFAVIAAAVVLWAVLDHNDDDDSVSA